MVVIELIKGLVGKHFDFTKTSDVDKTATLIVKELRNFRHSEVIPCESNVNHSESKGFYFFTWDIPFYKKLCYMITGRYPIIVDIKVIDCKILLTVNGRVTSFEGSAIAEKNTSEAIDALEIDISSDIISFRTKRNQ